MLASVENCVDARIQGLEEYAKKINVRLITEASNRNTNRNKYKLKNCKIWKTKIGRKTLVWKPETLLLGLERNARRTMSKGKQQIIRSKIASVD